MKKINELLSEMGLDKAREFVAQEMGSSLRLTLVVN